MAEQTMERTRIMLTNRDQALRLGRVTALVACELPAGFHALPRDEQRRELREALSDAAEKADDVVDSLTHRSAAA